MTSPSRTAHTEGDRGGPGRTLSSLAVAVGCALFLGGFAWAGLVYEPYSVPSRSMEPTLGAGSRVLAQRVDGGEVRRGDVVVFRDPAWGGLPVAKRVVGVGGDTVGCCDGRGRLTVDGAAVDEPYLRERGRASRADFEETVPPGRLFLLGDHRTGSLDSRTHLGGPDGGTVGRQAVVARVDAVVWPPGDVGAVERPEGFARLPGGVSRPGPLRPALGAAAAGALLIAAGGVYGPITAVRVRRARLTHNGETHR